MSVESFLVDRSNDYFMIWKLKNVYRNPFWSGFHGLCHEMKFRTSSPIATKEERRDEKRKAKWSQARPGQRNETKHGKHNSGIKTKQSTQNNYNNKKVNNGEPLFVINAKYTNMNCSAVDDVLISELELWQWNVKNKITPILLSAESIPSYIENTLN